MSYTKGPWEIAGNEHAHTIIGEKYVVADVFVPAEGCESPESEEEAEANARLISAAPDMLEALEAITPIASFGADYFESKGLMDFWRNALEAIEQAQKAIAKAKGGQA